MRIRFTIDIERRRQSAEQLSAPEVDDKGFSLVETASQRPVGFGPVPSWADESELRKQ